jgi:hypothetical protein
VEWGDTGLEIGQSWSEYVSVDADSSFLSLKWKARLFILLFLFNNYNKKARQATYDHQKVVKIAIELNKQGWNR